MSILIRIYNIVNLCYTRVASHVNIVNNNRRNYTYLEGELMYNSIYKYFDDPNNRFLTKEDLYRAFGNFSTTPNNTSLYYELNITSGNDILALETQKSSLDEILHILKNIPDDIRQQNENIINRHRTYNASPINNYKKDTTPILKEIIKDAIKQVISKLLKDNLTDEEKQDWEYCQDVLEAFDIIETRNNPYKQKIEKGMAIVRAKNLLVKYYFGL